VRVVRSAVLTVLGDAASDIENASVGYEKEQHPPEEFQEPFQRFDKLRRLLDTIGWGNVKRQIDVREHRDSLTSALEDRLDVNRDCIKDSWTEPADRKRLERETCWIEGFLTDNDSRAEDA
jgi:hypothetical protein